MGKHGEKFKRKITKKKKTEDRRHWEFVPKYLRAVVYHLGRTHLYLLCLIDGILSIIIWLQLYLYKSVAKRMPKFLEDVIVKLKEQITTLTDEIERRKAVILELNRKIESKEKEIRHLENSKDDWQAKITKVKKQREKMEDKLTEEKLVLEEEKQTALKRLSKSVSVNLRNNNPNIVDLNDQFRPTKLAEMFSELYDNEWTSAFAALSETFTDEQTIGILLEVVMEAYYFCAARVEDIWGILTEWLIDEKDPGAKEKMKWLKDNSKANIRKQFPKLGTDFSQKLTFVCEDDSLRKCLSEESVHAYLLKCVEICLLMVTTEPPVVLICPGRNASRMLQPDAPGVNTRGVDENKKPRRGSGQRNHVEDRCMDQQPRKGERPNFVRELFKEYTRRGEYMEYVVWPIMHLHKDGPLLCKGIAQGTEGQFRETTDLLTLWSWQNH